MNDYIHKVERTESTAIAVGGFKTVDVVCEIGSSVLGGGYLVLPSGQTLPTELGNVMVTRSSAVTQGSWRVKLQHVGDKDVSVIIEAFAVCAVVD